MQPAGPEYTRCNQSVMIESHAQAVSRICTHRCAHFPTVLMSPETCAKRKALIRSHPVTLGPLVYWICKDCPGPIPINVDIPQSKPRLPELTEHDKKYLKAKCCRCVTCGTTDTSQFDLGHSRKCNACRKAYSDAKNRRRAQQLREQKGPRGVCIQCGRNINVGKHANHVRIEMSLCGQCYAQYKSHRKNQ